MKNITYFCFSFLHDVQKLAIIISFHNVMMMRWNFQLQIKVNLSLQ